MNADCLAATTTSGKTMAADGLSATSPRFASACASPHCGLSAAIPAALPGSVAIQNAVLHYGRHSEKNSSSKINMSFLRNLLVHSERQIHEEIPHVYHIYFYILKTYRNDDETFVFLTSSFRKKSILKKQTCHF